MACEIADADATEEGTNAVAERAAPYVADALVHYNRAVGLHASGQLDEAVIEYKIAIDKDGRLQRRGAILADFI